jgi:2-(1,2-epoxy-1,2-dihydrophenyl)acetyl-CoA isomerase
MTEKTVWMSLGDDGVATVTLDRPTVKNAISLEMRDELSSLVSQIEANRQIKAVILRGAGSDFCSGGDIRSMQGNSAELGRNRMDELHGWFQRLINLDRPVIAAVDGVCYGIGFSLALAADMVLASSRARFCMPFMKVGLVPDGGSLYTLPRVVGIARAKELIFSAREIGAQEAHQLGIALEILEPELLLGRAQRIAASLAQSSLTSFALTKRALNQSLSSDLRTMLALESSAQGIAYTTDFHKEAIRRFREKEPALFQWPAV